MKTTSWLDFGGISILGPRVLEQRLQFSPTVVFCVCNKIHSSAIWNLHAFVSRRGRSWSHLSHTCLSQMKKSRLKTLEGMYISNMYIPPTVFFFLPLVGLYNCCSDPLPGSGGSFVLHLVLPNIFQSSCNTSSMGVV